jgi:hypothetical protein
MSDLEPVGSKEITNAGVRGVGATIGGVGLLVLRALSTAFWGVGGLVIGGLSFVVGAASVKSESKADRRGGTIAMVAGVALALPGLAKIFKIVPLLGGAVGLAEHLSSGIVGLGALGLLGYGIYNLVKFVKGLKSRR